MKSHMHPGTGLEIRPMAPGDLDRVVEIAASLPTAPKWPRSAYRAAISPQGQPHRVALVAVYEGVAIGFAVSRLVLREAELETIGMEARAQGYGFGSSLLLAMLEELKLAGADEILLEVRASNAQALAFYRNAGLVETGRRRAYYVDPVEDAILMRRSLPS